MGAKGESFSAPVIENVTIKRNYQMATGNILFIPGAGCNPLGRDDQIQLNLGVIPDEGRVVVCMLHLRPQDEEKINGTVWARSGNRGKLDIPPIRINIKDEHSPVRGRQYPISAEGKRGLQPMIKELLKAGGCTGPGACLWPSPTWAQHPALLPLPCSTADHHFGSPIAFVNSFF